MNYHEKEFNRSAYDFSMEEYKLNPSLKYNIINNRTALMSETAPTVVEHLAPDLTRDGEWYMSFLLEENGPSYYEDVILRARDKRFEAVPLDTEAIVTMPVSGLGDTEHIYSTVEKYRTQPQLVKRKTPILLWVNVLDSELNDASNRTLFQKTIDEIARAKQDFEDLNIIDMYYFVPETEVTDSLARGGPWGIIMKRAYDITAVASYLLTQRPGSKFDDIAIIRNDSDVIELDKDYFEQWFAALADSRDKYGLQGASRFGDSAEAEALFPGLSVIMNFIPELDFVTGDRYRFQAANFAIKASAYCQIGGMGRPFFTGIGSCDAMLGERLKAVTRVRNELRGQAVLDEEIIVPVAPRLVTDWSRPLAAYVNGQDPRRAWTGWSESPNGISQRKDNLYDIGALGREGLDESMRRVEAHISHLLLALEERQACQLAYSFFGGNNVTYNDIEGLRFTDKGISAYGVFYGSHRPYSPGAFM